MAGRVIRCLECDNRIENAREGQLFCSPAHRQIFNNRRMQRGAELYDLFRALRRERAEAKRLNLWTQICKLERHWQDEDERDRPGRKSYMPPRRALTILREKGSLPIGEILVRGRG